MHISSNRARLRVVLKSSPSARLSISTFAIVPDDKVDAFSRVNIENVSEKDKEFVKNIHDYYDNWTNWRPSNRIEEILKNAIDTIQ